MTTTTISRTRAGEILKAAFIRDMRKINLVSDEDAEAFSGTTTFAKVFPRSHVELALKNTAKDGVTYVLEEDVLPLEPVTVSRRDGVGVYATLMAQALRVSADPLMALAKALDNAELGEGITDLLDAFGDKRAVTVEGD